MAKLTIGVVLKVIEYAAVAVYTIAKAYMKEPDNEPPKKE